MRKKVFLNRSFDILPHEHVEKKVNEYALFMKEYENSNKYRLICSFKPICSNILFNTITEIVGDEGSDKCVFYGLNAPLKVDDKDLNAYLAYTNRNIRDEYNKFVYLTRAKMIEDTGYSHEKCGNIVYHCGYDIFNNHILRSKEFIVINKMNDDYDKMKDNSYGDKRPLFNTLSDYLRDAKGDIKKELNVKDETSRNVKEKRVYVGDSISNYFNTITENLTEIDGWIGFKNKVFLNIPNYGDNISINKVINNKSIGEFIDMYPDKTLFSILPKYNSYRDRYENNWEFCLTYPYANDEMHDLVNYQYTNNGVVYNYNGIECIFKLDDVLQIGEVIDTRLITLRTFVEHGLVNGDEIKISVFYKKKDGTTYTYETPNVCRVFGIGNTSYEKKQYFKIRIQDIQNLILNLMVYGVGTVDIKEDADGTLSFDPFALDIDFFEINGIKFRFTKVVGGRKSKYYLRKFKRLKTKDDTEYAYTLNKVAYSTTIFKERCGEIIFDEIIDVEGILDNNGRQLNEIFLTTFKTNYGHKEWYYDKIYTGETIEFSHCFGELSSGFDLPSDELCKDYNVHALHNIDKYIEDYHNETNKESFPKSGKPLDKELSKNNTTEFYGDLVEFNENSLQENILEEVYFRFNTAQREFYEEKNEEFNTIKYSEIIVDDEDCDSIVNNEVVNKSFKIEERDIRVDNQNDVDTNLHININPEGYIYKPNYRFLLKEYDENVYWGNDTYIELLTINYISSGSTFNNITVGKDMYEYEITCNEKILSEKYIYLNVYDKIYLTNKQNLSQMTYGVITHVDLKDKKYRFIIDIEGLPEPLDTPKIIDNYLFFRENPLKPKNVYMFKDGSGVYNWREFKKHSNIEQNSPLYQRPFVNGTHYLYKDIDFYLKRQDPNGLFMLSFNSDMQLSKINLIILGNQKDVSNNNYVKTMEPTLC